MVPVLQAVPNFSEGRDPDVIEELAVAAARAGADVIDRSSDPDHHRSVLTLLGDPASVERASLAMARVALDRIDLRGHQGVHPRIGALDVLPFVPLIGLGMDDAVASALRVGAALAQLGLPVFLYGAASRPPGRALRDLRRGGYEAAVERFSVDHLPDFLPTDWPHAGVHPTAGATCVGARPVLLAWNVYVDGVDPEDLRALAGSVREAGGGFAGLRALALTLPRRAVSQISMNLEDLERTNPLEVFAWLERRIHEAGGRVTGTEVIGMIPDGLVLSAAADRLKLHDAAEDRLLTTRLARHLAVR